MARSTGHGLHWENGIASASRRPDLHHDLTFRLEIEKLKRLIWKEEAFSFVMTNEKPKRITSSGIIPQPAKEIGPSAPFIPKAA
ncbi:hypothetical protein [Herbaspirillum sp. SJZ099]|uniref:hypothetical protein n=1 Tax=Herbaspirillum sp. SJZ099 TaxID=2572916 RepID=UPI0016474AC0|nr:hypothetical protein [Herbaspirillum sp. SJZ099]